MAAVIRNNDAGINRLTYDIISPPPRTHSTAGTVGATGHNLVMAENVVVKIRFRLLQGADGYPPCESEGLWATSLGGGAYRVANLPWFVPDVALGDVVRAEADRDGVLWAVARTEKSGNCTIRVAPLDVDQRTVFNTSGAMGTFGEGFGTCGVDIVALNVPRTLNSDA